MLHSLDCYFSPPHEQVQLDLATNMVTIVAQIPSGEAGSGGVDSISIQHWLLRFGLGSLGLRQIVREFGYWMSNGLPLWAAYRELMLERLIGLDKCPGVRSVGV